MTRTTYEPRSINDAWLSLATDILLFAIEDVRQKADREKREWARTWLLSEAAEFMFDMVMYERNFDIREWVLSDCPKLEEK